jgi:heme exporter protein B
LYGLLSARVRSGEVLLPLLLFPLEVPALLASSRSTDLVINGDPMNQLQAWMGLLLAFNLIFWSVCGLLFGRLLEE